ncbi:MAG: zinc ABC transporter substrate-binding protein [Deltaproteobacteria bacterium]|nr:zinc ABC transporter substrate-binding protein [Deltaproteobacteria bacterium]
MKKSLVFFIALVSILAFSQVAWGQGEKAKLPVFVSILPQAYFLERIGGHHVDVGVLVGEGQSPHTYEPTPKQMAKLATAKAYFRIGVPVERGVLRKIRQSHKNLVIVETQKGIAYRYLAGHDHDHGEGHVKDHEAKGHKTPDPHLWMDPKLVKIQARNIYDALCRLDTAHTQDYTGNLKAFLADLDRVDARISRSLAPLKGRMMYVFHPAFGYFADSYGLVQAPIEIEGKEPGAKQLAHLIERAKKDRVKVIFVQPQFSMRSAGTVAKEIGGVVVPINPLARDYLANLEKIASAVEQGIR